MKKIVLFVCYGNVYRSAIAEQCLRRLVQGAGLEDEIEVRSRGIQGFGGIPEPKFPNLRYYPEEWEGSRDTLAELGISLADHVATPISAADVVLSDVIIAMDKDVYDEGTVNLRQAFPDAVSKIRQFGEFGGLASGVSDPAGNSDPERHRQIILAIHVGVKAVFDHLMEGA